MMQLQHIRTCICYNMEVEAGSNKDQLIHGLKHKVHCGAESPKRASATVHDNKCDKKKVLVRTSATPNRISYKGNELARASSMLSFMQKQCMQTNNMAVVSKQTHCITSHIGQKQ